MIDQVTVFLENSAGRLSALTRCIADAQVNMSALTIAETAEFGVVRIVCRDAPGALAALRAGGFRASSAPVLAVAVPNKPGGLADVLETLDGMNVNIEYGYCFTVGAERAVDVIKIADPARACDAARALERAGFTQLTQEEL